MFYLIVMSLFFILSVVVHIIICRNQKQKGLLVKIFGIVAIINLLLCWGVFLWLGRFISFNTISLWNIPLPMTSTIIYILLLPAYLVFYTSTQLNSPSKKILLLLKKHGALTFQELLKDFTQEEFIMPRIKDLQETRCIQCIDQHWHLLPPGLTIAQFLNFYQIVLRRQAGG